MNKYLNGWVWVGLVGTTEAAFAVIGSDCVPYVSGRCNSIGRCLLAAKRASRGGAYWEHGDLTCLSTFNARPLTFAEYAAIGGDL